jgi:hypothetical protein
MATWYTSGIKPVEGLVRRNSAIRIPEAARCRNPGVSKRQTERAPEILRLMQVSS